jgi:hypothetical protein
MNCTHRNAIREEREACAVFAEERGQRWLAIRIRNGEHRATPVRYRENDEPTYRNDETQT